MDLIFKRYPSPLFFLDYCLENSSLDEVVMFIYEQTNEDKYWQMYLSTLPLNDKSYNDWKKEVKGGTSTSNDTNFTKEDADTVIKNSQDILSGFKPPQ